MKTYTTKANANRAAKNLDAGTFDIIEIDGRFMIEQIVPTAEVVVDTPAEEILAPENEEGLIKIGEIKQKSLIEKPVKEVWVIADCMWGQRRKDIIQACVDSGIAYNTARTQYQAYFKVKSKEGK